MPKFEGHDELSTLQETQASITRLKDGIQKIKDTIEDFRKEKETAPLEEQENLDGEISRYEQSLAINEQELKEMESYLLSLVDENDTVN